MRGGLNAGRAECGVLLFDSYFPKMLTRASSKRFQPPTKRARVEFDLQCPIGLETIENEVTFPCGHYICAGCWNKTLQQSCPICRAPIPLGFRPLATAPFARRSRGSSVALGVVNFFVSRM